MKISSKNIIKKTLLAQALCLCICFSPAIARALVIRGETVILNGKFEDSVFNIQRNGTVKGDATFSPSAEGPSNTFFLT